MSHCVLCTHLVFADQQRCTTFATLLTFCHLPYPSFLYSQTYIYYHLLGVTAAEAAAAPPPPPPPQGIQTALEGIGTQVGYNQVTVSE